MKVLKVTKYKNKKIKIMIDLSSIWRWFKRKGMKRNYESGDNRQKPNTNPAENHTKSIAKEVSNFENCKET